MARPLSDEKRLAILAAATDVVAQHGTAAPTAKIAQVAGVAEGTLFKYFASKEVLLNALYVSLKTELRDAMLGDFPASGSAKEKSLYVWLRYVNWGAKRPAPRRALQQLSVSDLITPASHQQASEGFGSLRDLTQDWPCLCGPRCVGGEAFAAAILASIADTTIDFMARQPKRAKQIAEEGFNAFWRAAAG